MITLRAAWLQRPTLALTDLGDLPRSVRGKDYDLAGILGAFFRAESRSM